MKTKIGITRRTIDKREETQFTNKMKQLRLIVKNSIIPPQRNPLLKQIEKLDNKAEPSMEFLKDYFSFPIRIVGILTRAKNQMKSYPLVHKELERNINEEMGKYRIPQKIKKQLPEGNFTHADIFHYSILLLGINLKDHTISLETNNFLNSLESQFVGNIISERVAGSIAAIEHSASVELKNIRRLVFNIDQAKNQQLIRDFFDLHTIVEKDHDCGLENALIYYIKNENRIRLFEEGFLEVISAMESWWEQLAIRAKKFAK